MMNGSPKFKPFAGWGGTVSVSRKLPNASPPPVWMAPSLAVVFVEPLADNPKWLWNQSIWALPAPPVLLKPPVLTDPKWSMELSFMLGSFGALMSQAWNVELEHVAARACARIEAVVSPENPVNPAIATQIQRRAMV